MSKKTDKAIDISVFTSHPDATPEWAERTRALIGGMRKQGIHVIEQEKHHEHFVIIDRNIIWYGNANFLSRRKPSDNVVRMLNPEIATDILYAMSAKS